MIRTRLLVLLGIVVLLCVVGLSSRANVVPPAPAIKWEYKVIAIHGIAGEQAIQDELNKAGADGWEMAVVFSDVRGGGAVATRGSFVLKRQKR